MEALDKTFSENLRALENCEENVYGPFAAPLVTRGEMVRFLDGCARSFDSAEVFDCFVAYLLGRSDDWLQEEDVRIGCAVSRFFAEHLCGGLEVQYIEEYLREEHPALASRELESLVCRERLEPLISRAWSVSSLYGVMRPELPVGTLSFVSAPQASNLLQGATMCLQETHPDWQVNPGTSIDRTEAIALAVGSPFVLHPEIEEWTSEYYGTPPIAGCHIFEGNPIPGAIFDDWTNLPPLGAWRYFDGKVFPELATSIIEHACRLYEQALRRGAFVCDSDDSGYDELLLCEVDDETEHEAETLLSLGINAIDEFAVDFLRAVLSQVKSFVVRLSPKRRYTMRVGSCHHSRVAREFFISSPAIQLQVKATLERIDELENRLDDLTKELEARLEEAEREQKRAEFCNAVYTGVITYEGLRIVYRPDEQGEGSDIVLSDATPEHPYWFIPLYQAFLSYQGLDQELEDEIQAEVSSRLADKETNLRASVEAIREEMTDARLDAWGKGAELFLDEKEGILAFLQDSRSQLDEYSADLDLITAEDYMGDFDDEDNDVELQSLAYAYEGEAQEALLAVDLVESQNISMDEGLSR